jgi:hypothetical protein
MPGSPSPQPSPIKGEGRSRVLIWLEWGALALLIGGVAAYLFFRPLNPMGDPQAAQALALVQTHPARSAPSIRQALDAVLDANRKPGRAPAIGAWTARAAKERGAYVVRVEVRGGWSGSMSGWCGWGLRPSSRSAAPQPS